MIHTIKSTFKKKKETNLITCFVVLTEFDEYVVERFFRHIQLLESNRHITAHHEMIDVVWLLLAQSFCHLQYFLKFLGVIATVGHAGQKFLFQMCGDNTNILDYLTENVICFFFYYMIEKCW